MGLRLGRSPGFQFHEEKSMGIMNWILGRGCENVSPEEVRLRTTNGEKLVLLDVRTPQEHAHKKIKGSRLVPLQELGSRYAEIPKDREVVVFCQNGIRSIMACRMLKKLGYERVKNMTGGISRW